MICSFLFFRFPVRSGFGLSDFFRPQLKLFPERESINFFATPIIDKSSEKYFFSIWKLLSRFLNVSESGKPRVVSEIGAIRMEVFLASLELDFKIQLKFWVALCSPSYLRDAAFFLPNTISSCFKRLPQPTLVFLLPRPGWMVIGELDTYVLSLRTNLKSKQVHLMALSL